VWTIGHAEAWYESSLLDTATSHEMASSGFQRFSTKLDGLSSQDQRREPLCAIRSPNATGRLRTTSTTLDGDLVDDHTDEHRPFVYRLRYN
jgi:hypothetical protein